MKFKSFCVFLSLMMAGCANFPVEDIYTEKLTTEKRHVDDVDIRVDVSTLTDDIVLVKVCDSGVTISPGIRTQLSCHTWSAPGAEANEPGFGFTSVDVHQGEEGGMAGTGKHGFTTYKTLAFHKNESGDAVMSLREIWRANGNDSEERTFAPESETIIMVPAPGDVSEVTTRSLGVMGYLFVHVGKNVRFDDGNLALN